MKTQTSIKSKINAAFSLVELLVVIAVIAVIAAIAIPNITGTREAAAAAAAADVSNNVVRMARSAYASGYTNLGDPATNYAGWSNALTTTGITNVVAGTNVVFKLQ